MNLSKFAIRRPITVLMIVVGIMILGFVSSGKISINLLPDITYPKVTIRTEYPHAAPAEVEKLVTEPIEQSVGIITEVMKVSSISKPGMSEVVVEFSWRSDMDVKTMDIREKLQIIEAMFPDEIKRPVILRYDPSTDPIITIAVAADMDLADLRYLVEREVERELERIEGVAAVKVQGGYEEEIVVEVDEAKLTQYNMTIQAVIEKLRRENINLAGGTLEDAGQELSVRTLNQFQTLDDIRDIVILSSTPITGAGPSIGGVASSSGIPAGFGGFSGMISGLSSLGALTGLMGAMLPTEEGETGAAYKVTAPIRLRDIATVNRRHKERTEIARLNGQECIKVAVYKEGDANIVRVAEDVHENVKGIRENLRSEPRSNEWERKLMSPGRKLKKALNATIGLLFSFRPFSIEEEPLELINDLDMVIISDQSVFIRQAIYSVVQMAIWGAAIAVLVLFFFLRNPGSTAIIALAIPISVITTFIIMYFADISFNTMSLGGLALGVGLLVDNSIVVLENILRNRVFVKDLSESASVGADEVSNAITASTLTNIMVFFPILYVEGMFRQVFGDLAWTVTISIVTSELVALAVIPMLSVHLGKGIRLPTELLDEMELPEGYEPTEEDEKPKDAPRPLRFRIISFQEYRKDRATMLGALLSYPIVVLATFLAFPMLWLKRTSVGSFNVVMYYPLQIFDVTFTWLKRAYPALIRRLIRRPGQVFAASLVIASLTMISLYILGWELMPNVDQNEFRVNIKLNTGTPIEKTNLRMADIENKIRTLVNSLHVRDLFSTVGIGVAEGEMESEKSENIGELNVILSPRRDRDFTDDEFMDEVRVKISDEVNLNASFSKPQLLSYKTPIEIEIVGYNLDELREAADKIAEKIGAIDGIYDIDTSTKETNPEITIRIDRDRAANFGLSVGEITDSIRKKIKGELATKLDKGDRQVDIIVRASEEDRSTLRDLDLLAINLPAGITTPLKSVADIIPSRGPGSITRVGNSRIALVTANLSQRTLGDVVGEIQENLDNLELPHGTFWRITGQNEEMQRSLKSLYLAIFLAVCLVYIVLAIQFESLLHPFVIMFCIPYSLVGLTILMYLTGTSINVFSLIGMMMMFGISVNDAIVMITTINLRRAEGIERLEAVVYGARTRLRPILITTTTTVLGMVPMALPLGEGAELRNPLAIAVIGGILSSTMFTLCAIPSAYLVIDRAGVTIRSMFKRETKAP